jgi:hypothetical protein
MTCHGRTFLNQNLPENQCIFIRGFRITRFSMILPRLRGAAGPARVPEGDSDSDKQLQGIPVDSSVRKSVRI